jgi:PHP family Zn ribbon phosphoesterase
MKKYRDFTCLSCSYKFDERVEDDIHRAPCHECGNPAKRGLSSPKCFQNTTGRSPSATPKKGV